MINDTDLEYRPGRTPPATWPSVDGDRSGMEGRGPGRPRRDAVRELREGIADRVPVSLRALPGGVPWRAAIAALVFAVVAGSALLARAQGTSQDVAPPLPARTTAAQAARTGPGVVVAGGGGRAQAGPVLGGPSPPGAVVVVHVVGRVRRPGLVRLSAGSRVSDAVTAAGGATAEARLERLNLARALTDGEQIAVPGANDPVPPAGGPGGGVGGGPVGGSGAAAGSAGAPVDLNTATAADLDALPGVGPVLAGRILQWRTQHSRFSRVAELGEVPGIGDKLLARLTPLVRV